MFQFHNKKEVSRVDQGEGNKESNSLKEFLNEDRLNSITREEVSQGDGISGNEALWADVLMKGSRQGLLQCR